MVAALDSEDPVIAVRSRVLHVHPERDDVVVERVDGEPPNFILICSRHTYAARAVGYMDDVGQCPHCELEADDDCGRLRYIALHEAMSR